MKKLFAFAVFSALAATAVAADSVPVYFEINSPEQFARWTSIDANSDGTPYRWEYSEANTAALYTQNKSVAADDWIITPAVALRGGSTYVVTAYVRNLSTFTFDKQKFDVVAGDAPTAAGMTVKLATETSLAKTSYIVERGGKYSPAADGDYHFGVHCYSASYNGDFIVAAIRVEEVVAHAGAATDVTVTAGAEGALSATVDWTWPALNSEGGAQQPLTGAQIHRGTTSSFTPSDATLVATLGEGGAPGSRASYTDISVPAAGKYYYRVLPVDAAGLSTAASTSVQSPWIGPDSGVSGAQVTAAADPTDDKTILLTFAVPTGTNGGYIDPASVSYKIVRVAGSTKEETTLEADWAPGTDRVYADRTIPGLDSYTYKIYNIYGGSASWSATTTASVTAGGAAAIPYSQEFATSAALDLYTVFHGAEGTRDWGHSSSKKAANFWGGTKADAWLVTPLLALEAGKAYRLTFDTWLSAGREAAYKDLYVYTGTGASAEALTAEIFHEQIQSQYQATKEVIFGVTEGPAYVAFRVWGQSNSDDIFLKNVRIEEIEVIPAAVTDASATAAADGALTATVAWTNPSLSNAGTPLAAIDRVEVRSGEAVLSTVTDAAPGAASQTTVTAAAAGRLDLAIVAICAGKESEPAALTTPWIGPDTPKAPAAVSVDVTDAGRVVSYEAVAEGAEGGYVDPAAITYTVLRDGAEIASGLTALTYTDTEADLPLAKHVYAVKAVAGELASEAAEAVAVIFGADLELPYRPSMATADDTDLWTLANEGGTAKTFKYDSDQQALVASSADADSWAITPPMRMMPGTVSVSAKFTCYSYRWPEEVEIYLLSSATMPAPAVVAKIADVHIESADFADVQTFTVDIPFADTTDDGSATYYIGYKLHENNWTCRIHQSDIEQTATLERPAPAAVADLTVTPAALGELALTVAWTNPAVDPDVPGAGLTSVTVLAGGKVVETVEAPVPGEAASAKIVVDAPGRYEYTVVAANRDKLSEPAATGLSAWTGPDTPKAPASVAVSIDGGLPVVSFTAVTEGIEGGYIDPAAVTYAVRRGADIVAADLAATTWAETAPIADGEHIYAVAATHAGLTGDWTEAKPVQYSGIGAIYAGPATLSADGSRIVAPEGSAIAVYTLSGIMVASGTTEVAVDTLAAGCYIAAVAGPDGSYTVFKFNR